MKFAKRLVKENKSVMLTLLALLVALLPEEARSDIREFLWRLDTGLSVLSLTGLALSYVEGRKARIAGFSLALFAQVWWTLFVFITGSFGLLPNIAGHSIVFGVGLVTALRAYGPTLKEQLSTALEENAKLREELAKLRENGLTATVTANGGKAAEAHETAAEAAAVKARKGRR